MSPIIYRLILMGVVLIVGTITFIYFLSNGYMSLSVLGLSIITYSIFKLHRLYKKEKILHLIIDNPLLAYPSDINNTKEDKYSDYQKTIFSTFGLLHNNQVYSWGYQGLKGNKLLDVNIGRDRISIRYGTCDYKEDLVFEHQIEYKKDAENLRKKILIETGIKASMEEWL